MEKVKLKFRYKKKDYFLECNKKDKIKDVCKKFTSENGLDFISKLFIYDDQTLSFDSNLTVKQQFDLDISNENEFEILVIENSDKQEKVYNAYFDGNTVQVKGRKDESLLNIFKRAFGNLTNIDKIKNVFALAGGEQFSSEKKLNQVKETGMLIFESGRESFDAGQPNDDKNEEKNLEKNIGSGEKFLIENEKNAINEDKNDDLISSEEREQVQAPRRISYAEYFNTYLDQNVLRKAFLILIFQYILIISLNYITYITNFNYICTNSGSRVMLGIFIPDTIIILIISIFTNVSLETIHDDEEDKCLYKASLVLSTFYIVFVLFLFILLSKYVNEFYIICALVQITTQLIALLLSDLIFKGSVGWGFIFQIILNLASLLLCYYFWIKSNLPIIVISIISFVFILYNTFIVSLSKDCENKYMIIEIVFTFNYFIFFVIGVIAVCLIAFLLYLAYLIFVFVFSCFCHCCCGCFFDE